MQPSCQMHEIASHDWGATVRTSNLGHKYPQIGPSQLQTVIGLPVFTLLGRQNSYKEEKDKN